MNPVNECTGLKTVRIMPHDRRLSEVYKIVPDDACAADLVAAWKKGITWTGYAIGCDWEVF